MSSLTPLEIPLTVEGEPALREAQVRQWTWAFVWIGVALRVLRYAFNHPLWGDEAFLGANFIDNRYIDLLGPLDYGQIAPPLFLWAELTAVKLFGISELSLRLFPMLCGVASMLLFRRLAAKLLGGIPLLLAVMVLAVSFTPNRHAAEVKPYASDLLVALVLLDLATAWLQRPTLARPLWLLALLAPLALGMSYPAVFVCGGIGLVLLVPVWRTGRLPVRLAFAAFGVMVFASFGLLLVLSINAQNPEALSGTHRYWAAAFPPPLSQPGPLALWLLEMHTSHMFAYPVGGAHGASLMTTLLVAIGAIRFWREGRRPILALLLAPFGLGLVAAFLDRYPYGGSARTMQYVAPAICLLMAVGATALLARRHSLPAQRRLVRLAMVLCMVVALVPLARDGVCRYKEIEDRQARDFARQFWTRNARDAELACLRSDLGLELDPEQWLRGRSAVYLCNQAIYSPRHHRHEPLDWQKVSRKHPLRVVVFNEEPVGLSYDAWLAGMRQSFELRDVKHLRPVFHAYKGRQAVIDDVYVLEFVPRPVGDGWSQPSARTALAEGVSSAGREARPQPLAWIDASPNQEDESHDRRPGQTATTPTGGRVALDRADTPSGARRVARDRLRK